MLFREYLGFEIWVANGNFRKMGTCLGVRVIRMIVYWCLYWGPLFGETTIYCVRNRYEFIKIETMESQNSAGYAGSNLDEPILIPTRTLATTKAAEWPPIPCPTVESP